MSVWRWPDLAEGIAAAHRFTLGEGETPLVRSRRIGPEAGLERLYFKVESANPTGSYKDRFGARAVASMVMAGASRCLATSSGNTGAALAAYCAIAGLPCEIAIVETAPAAKLTQMLAYGAQIYRVRGFGTDAATTTAVMEHLRARAARPGISLQISAYRYSAPGMRGVQSLAYELSEQLPEGLDHVFCPAGGGGLTLAVARGFEHLAAVSRLAPRPRIECVQPEGNDTIAGPLRAGDPSARAVVGATRVSGLQVPDVIDGHETLAACRASGGTGHTAADAYTWELQARMAAEEGIFSEPAGAVALAGALQAATRGEIRSDAVVVCLVTGSGFKDAPSVERMVADRECPMYTLAELQGRRDPIP